jgi:hypothetical protein
MNEIQLRRFVRKVIQERLSRKSKKLSLSNMLFEEDEDKKDASTEGGGLVDINAGPDAVLAAAETLDTSILRAGQTDSAGPGDEAFEIVGDNVKASSLEPTQSQVGTGQSLNDQAADKFGNLDRAIAGGKLSSGVDEEGGSIEFPILVFKNKILDGHHRWSQFITTNPDAMVDVARLEAPGVDTADGALGLAHFINFALFGKSPTKPFKGENVYGMDRAAIYDMALENMAETTPPKLKKAGLIDEETPEAAANHFADNLSKIPGPGDHPRTSMPQSADAGEPSGLTKTPKEVSAGAINYLDPSEDDVKEESKSRTTDEMVMERWQSLAGLLKG